MRFLALLLLCAAAPLSACINTDPAIFVDPTFTMASATVTTGPLGTGITGSSFVLDLHLGARAAGPSTVSMPEFSIKDAKGVTDIVSPLVVSSGDLTFPATVQQDSDVIGHFTFDTGANKTLNPMVGTELCASGGVTLGGVVDDSLSGRSTPIPPFLFFPTGCSP